LTRAQQLVGVVGVAALALLLVVAMSRAFGAQPAPVESVDRSAWRRWKLRVGLSILKVLAPLFVFAFVGAAVRDGLTWRVGAAIVIVCAILFAAPAAASDAVNWLNGRRGR
jgi:hypothetical protein